MKYEISRQVIHLCGLVFIAAAQFTGGFLISIIFFVIALAFLIYSEHVKSGGGFLGRLKELALKMDRNANRPFIGAFWFYLGLGLTFIIFPLNIATAASIMLSVGDSLSTIVGIRYGEHKIAGNKSLEGSIAFFLSGFLATLLYLGIVLNVTEMTASPVPLVAFMGAISATFLELIPGTEAVRKWEKKVIVDDNWLIPIFSGLIMHSVYILATSA